MKLSKILLLTPKADSINNKVKIHHEAELIQLRTKKLIVTSEMHNWSSDHPTNMILNFLETLLSYI